SVMKSIDQRSFGRLGGSGTLRSEAATRFRFCLRTTRFSWRYKRLAKFLEEFHRFLPPRFVPERRPTEADHSAGAPLGNSECSEKIAHSLAPSGGLYHFFRTTALSIWMSRAWSATSCLSRRFSSSSCFNLLASLTSIPPNFAFQR